MKLKNKSKPLSYRIFKSWSHLRKSQVQYFAIDPDQKKVWDSLSASVKIAWIILDNDSDDLEAECYDSLLSAYFFEN